LVSQGAGSVRIGARCPGPGVRRPHRDDTTVGLMLSRWFCNERTMMVLILLNGIAITLSYFPLLERHAAIHVIDRIFTLLFIVEAAVKIATWGPRSYFSRGWNRFDFVLTALGAPSLVQELVPLPDLSFWLVLRLFRLARLVRLIDFVPHIDQVLAGLGRALRASLLVLGVLAFLNYMLAMLTCHLFRDVAPEMFGNPFRAMYSMFQVFTIEGWNDIPAAVIERIEQSEAGPAWLNGHVVTALVQTFFATVLLFGGILGLSLANAVFVDEMTIDNTAALEGKVDALQRQFDELLAVLKDGRGG
jgi:voltage-gated sodium channel